MILRRLKCLHVCAFSGHQKPEGVSVEPDHRSTCHRRSSPSPRRQYCLTFNSPSIFKRSGGSWIAHGIEQVDTSSAPILTKGSASAASRFVLRGTSYPQNSGHNAHSLCSQSAMLVVPNLHFSQVESGCVSRGPHLLMWAASFCFRMASPQDLI